MKTNITQPNPSLPYAPERDASLDDVIEYLRRENRTLNERIKDIYNRIDTVIPYTATGSQVLTSDVTAGAAGFAGNVKWAAAAGAGTITTKDEGSTLSSTVTTLDFTGTRVTASGAGATTTVNVPALLTTKGDLMAFSSVEARVPIGTDAQVLTADSAQTLGLKWAAPAAVGILQSQEFTSSGTWTRPSGVTGVWLTMVGGGGGGSTTIIAATGGGGGGAGEVSQNFAVVVAADVTVTIGAAGTGGAAGQGSAQVGVAGGDTSFGTAYIARGGLGGATSGASGAGGGVGGGVAKSVSNPGVAGAVGISEAPTYFGGGSGGSGSNSVAAGGGAGAGCGPYVGAAGGASAASKAGGGGGASSIYGAGGIGGAGGAIGTNAAATAYGTGGGGGGGQVTTTIGGGDGAKGYLLVQWVA